MIFYNNGEVYRGMIDKGNKDGLGELVSKDGKKITRGRFAFEQQSPRFRVLDSEKGEIFEEVYSK
jgi:hypothetical protein